MNTVDLTPLYRSSIGFDRLANLLDNMLRADTVSPNYPPYNIEALEDNHYAITLAVSGFTEQELDINVEKGVLSVRGEKTNAEQHNYLYQGIANRSFERKFNLDDQVEVVDASLDNGLLSISLVKEIPEAMKPKTIAITKGGNVLEHKEANKPDAKDEQAA
ncbi:Hsp20 family protein [Dasania marina]|uniref:Hsp20 family protein n=1 Tax=Dasania marina TaxID=471499 RepID=UPI00037DA80A|nr:Hsp20 family protein [Dasania marina]